jgi:hypothetical protein
MTIVQKFALVFSIYMPCVRSAFRYFERKYWVHLRVNTAVLGEKECVWYMGKLNKMWLIRAMIGGKGRASKGPMGSSNGLTD